MNIFTKLKDDHYLTRADRLIHYTKIFALKDECYKLGMFKDVQDIGSGTLDKCTLYCYHEENTEVGSIVMRDTYYFIYGNTCIAYSKSGQDRIVTVKIKQPNDRWNFSITFGNLNFNNETIDVYTWWDVDWLKTGKRDYNTYAKPGSWWKYVCDDACSIFESVARNSVEWHFNENYSEYSLSKKS